MFNTALKSGSRVVPETQYKLDSNLYGGEGHEQRAQLGSDQFQKEIVDKTQTHTAQLQNDNFGRRESNIGAPGHRGGGYGRVNAKSGLESARDIMYPHAAPTPQRPEDVNDMDQKLFGLAAIGNASQSAAAGQAREQLNPDHSRTTSDLEADHFISSRSMWRNR